MCIMLRLVIIAVLLSCLISCKEKKVVDHGQWVRIQETDDSIVNGFALVDGKIYYGYFDLDFIENYLSKTKEGFIENADIETFEICVGTDYARDKNFVYYPIESKCVDGWEYGGCFVTKYLLAKARPDKFKYVRDGYAVSGNHMFYEGEEIVWRDDILNDSIQISDRIISQNVLKEKSLLEKLKEIEFEFSIGLPTDSL